MRRPTAAILLAAVCALVGGAASAFGTINAAHQSAEHEMITRRALACTGAATAANLCLEPKTLTEIAGGPGEAGAVGYPDLSANFFKSRAHCDNGDQPGALAECRGWMEANMRAAVTDARKLLSPDGRIAPSQVTLGCSFAFNLKGRAKCNVIQDLGITLHASQDFYSHSNWVDSTADHAPVGLGNQSPARYIDLRTFPKSVPPGLVSGCYALGGGCGTRLSHETLNKDLGPIGATPGSPVGPGLTSRGDHNGNFERAVGAAVLDTQDKWAVLRERLIATYGPVKGARMACALARDEPVGKC